LKEVEEAAFHKVKGKGILEVRVWGVGFPEVAERTGIHKQAARVAFRQEDGKRILEEVRRVKGVAFGTAGPEGRRILAEMRRLPLQEVAERARILEQMAGVALRNLEGKTRSRVEEGRTRRRVEEQRTLVAAGLDVLMKASLQEKMGILYQQVPAHVPA
jgi:hypothetical protein